ncbi:EamA domain [Dillenia turbinata]|uniref:WAT1-related protein n=1 Tax=Dillenia turbinata TaxID=194707 RepID=A0AAN8VTW7_9MAGN
MGRDVAYLMFVETHKSYIVMLFIQFVYAGMALFSKAAILKGMNPFVFVVYRQALASIALAPFAYFFERNGNASLSYILLFKIFLISLCGLTLSLNLYYIAIKFTSATFAAATTNTIPAITFAMAVILRMEIISTRQLSGLAKLLGSIAGVSGALVFAFVKGTPIHLFNWYQSNKSSNSPLTYSVTNGSIEEWLKGPLVMLSANTAWSLWLVLQAPIVKQYPAKLRLTTLQCLFSCIQSACWAIGVERNIGSWKLGWDIHLLSVAYCGVVVTGITYWLQVWVIEKKGPVFTAMFTPLALVITAFFSAFLWKETLYWGRYECVCVCVCERERERENRTYKYGITYE